MGSDGMDDGDGAWRLRLKELLEMRDGGDHGAGMGVLFGIMV
jgi:hypothetical protein